MTERERWVVYPLLFLALGAALRDKLVDRTTTKSLICQELLVVDEQPLGREPVLLARLGRAERSNAQEPVSGNLILNGQIEIVDRDPSNQLAHRLITIGRAQFGPNTAAGGSILVNGQLLVNGAINATFYAYQGHPLLPALRSVLPGASIPAELLRAVPEAIAPVPNNVPGTAPSRESEEGRKISSPSEEPTDSNSPPANSPAQQSKPPVVE